MTIRRILRVLGSRYGIAALLLLAVVGVVTVAKATGDGNPTGSTSAEDTVDNVEPGAPDDGYVEPSATNDTGEDPSDDGSLPESAVTVAMDFARAWIDTDGKSREEWHNGLTPHATERLAEQLAQTDPEVVPASELRGDPATRNTHVEIETDAGLLSLRMKEQDGSWYVDGIDFPNP